jgi:hypothetical protein
VQQGGAANQSAGGRSQAHLLGDCGCGFGNANRVMKGIRGLGVDDLRERLADAVNSFR